MNSETINHHEIPINSCCLIRGLFLARSVALARGNSFLVRIRIPISSRRTGQRDAGCERADNGRHVIRARNQDTGSARSVCAENCSFEVSHAMNPVPSNVKDMTGLVFGRLTVESFSGINSVGRCAEWICRCSCGVVKAIRGLCLRQGKTQSCGCLNKERGPLKGGYRHGLGGRGCRHELYATWSMMRRRCQNPNDECYHNYGGRGIKVCERWDLIANFVADMHPRPSKKHTLERVNNDGDYEPSNCIWATRIENNNNTRATHFLEFDGKRMSVRQWERHLNWNAGVVSHRLMHGWTVERALTQPPQIHKDRKAA